MATTDRSQEVLQYLKQYCKDSGKKKLPKIEEIASNFNMTVYEVGKWMRSLISSGFLTLNYNHWGFSKDIWEEITAPPKLPDTTPPVVENIPVVKTTPSSEYWFIRLVENLLHNHKLSQYVIFIIALAISCFLVGQMGWGISTNKPTQFICLFIFIFIDIMGQYCLGKGKFHREKKNKKQYIYFFVFSIYVVIFSIPASVGFFNSELSTQSAAISLVENKTARVEQRLSQISNSFIFEYALLAHETNSGYGKRVSQIQSNITELEREQTALNSSLDTRSSLLTSTERETYFSTLSKALWGFPEALIKVIMFGVAMIMLVFAIIITCPAFGSTVEVK